jgi:predicted Rossmann fold flavoprotein
MSEITRDVVVIGAGLAGLMAGIEAARRDRSVLVLEPGDEPCARFVASGSGAAPVSNRNLNVSGFHGRYARFVSDALKALPEPDLRQWFDAIGITLTEAEHYGHIVATGGGEPVRDAMVDALQGAGAELRTGCPIETLEPEGAGFRVTPEGGEPISASAVILAGSLHPGADWPRVAAALGHTSVPALPAQTPLPVDDAWIGAVGGLWMDVTVTVVAAGKPVLERTGSMLFDGAQVSGQVIFNVSGEVTRRIIGGEPVALLLDFYPTLSREEVAQWLHRVLGEGTRERAAFALDRMIPQRLAEAFLRDLKMKPDARAMRLELRDRVTLLERMTATRLTVGGPGQWDSAEGSTGGVNVREVSPRTFESRVRPGLFFTGGMLDVSGDWGGFEQHFALASGMLAGRHA